MTWNEAEIPSAIATGLLRFYTAIGRAINEKSISMRADYLSKYFDGYTAEKVGLFFDWISETFDKFIPDRDFKKYAFEKKDYDFTQNGAGTYFYSISGALVRHGTFYTMASITGSEWHLLPSREKELSLKAKHNLLVGPEYQDWRQICEKRYKVKPGKIQKPREEWNAEDFKIYEQYLDWYDNDLKKWDEYEKKLIN